MNKVGPILKMISTKAQLLKSTLREQFGDAFFERAIFHNYFRSLAKKTADSRLLINISAFLLNFFSTSKVSLFLTCLNPISNY